MLKISWYWWVIGVLLILLFLKGNSNTNSSRFITQLTDTTNNKLDEYKDTAPAGPVTSTLVADIKNNEVSTNTSPATEGISVPIVSASTLHEVVRVIDGDTIEVMYERVKRKVRYIGIDTPETVHPNKPVECMGKEASTYNSSLVTGKQVRLERDISDTDKYGRLLRYVYVDEMMVNEVLVREGYANVMTYPPNVKYNERFLALEQEARAGKKGLWSDVCREGTTAVASSKSPEVTHASKSDASCHIKGNISSSQEKIFHVPGCQSYEKTVISEDAGERWFCTEEEAINAGWRKALNCG